MTSFSTHATARFWLPSLLFVLPLPSLSLPPALIPSYMSGRKAFGPETVHLEGGPGQARLGGSGSCNRSAVAVH